MSEPTYYAANENDEPELVRIKALEELADSHTIRRIEALGISSGWNCLEVAAGAGSVAKWLAVRTGPEGKVVATDINTRFLEHLVTPNLEIRRHDITKDDLETNHYDLVHCRFLLMHLPEPEKVVKRLAAAVRPGGWILVEDFDFGSVLSNDIANPSAYEASRARMELFRKNGFMDPWFGRRVRPLIEQLGFQEFGHEGNTRVGRGGERALRFTILTNQITAQPMIAAGLLTREEHERGQALLNDPNFYTLGPTNFAAWGRKPANQNKHR
jgi:SAM-dependent methyltransferase